MDNWIYTAVVIDKTFNRVVATRSFVKQGRAENFIKNMDYTNPEKYDARVIPNKLYLEEIEYRTPSIDYTLNSESD